MLLSQFSPLPKWHYPSGCTDRTLTWLSSKSCWVFERKFYKTKYSSFLRSIARKKKSSHFGSKTQLLCWLIFGEFGLTLSLFLGKQKRESTSFCKIFHSHSYSGSSGRIMKSNLSLQLTYGNCWLGDLGWVSILAYLYTLPFSLNSALGKGKRVE